MQTSKESVNICVLASSISAPVKNLEGKRLYLPKENSDWMLLLHQCTGLTLKEGPHSRKTALSSLPALKCVLHISDATRDVKRQIPAQTLHHVLDSKDTESTSIV